MTPRLADQDARDRIQNALDETLVVEAAAGTGKTTELVKRIVRVIATGRATIDRDRRGHVHREGGRRAEAAAARGARTGTPRGGRTGDAAALAAFERGAPAPRRGARQHHPRLLRRPAARAAGRGPRRSAVRRADRGPGGSRLRRGLPDWLQAQLLAPREGVRRALRRTARRNFGRDVDEDGPVERLRQAGRTLLQWRDHPAPWTRDPAATATARSTRCCRPSRSSRRSAPSPHRRDDPCLQEPHRRASPRRRDRPGTPRGPARLRRLGSRRSSTSRGTASSASTRAGKSAYAPGVAREQILSAREQLIERADVVPAAPPTRISRRCCTTSSRIASRRTRTPSRRRARSTSSICCSRPRPGPRQRRRPARFPERFTRIFVDEFQDTDPLQAEILLLLAADESSLDRSNPTGGPPGPARRAVHRRRSEAVDLPLPPRRRRHLSRVCDQLGGGRRRRLQLTTQLPQRADDPACVNAAFAPVMQDDPVTLQAGYVPLSEVRGDWPDQPS